MRKKPPKSSNDVKDRLKELRSTPSTPRMRPQNPAARQFLGGSTLQALPLHSPHARLAPFMYTVDQGKIRVEPQATPAYTILCPKLPDESASDWLGRPPYIVYRRCVLHAAKDGRPATIEMDVRGPDPLGSNAPAQQPPIGYDAETYTSFAEAYRAARMTKEQCAVQRWVRQLQAEHDRRELKQREKRLAKTGSAELPHERKMRHRLQWLYTDQSKRAYAIDHDGEDGLDAEEIRRLLADHA